MITDIAFFETKRIIKSPGTWLIIAACQFLLALIFYNLLSKYLSDPALFEGRGITDAVIASYYRSAGLVFLLVAPFLTMRLISEEAKNGSIKLLLSAPVKARHIIIGKYLAVTAFMMFLIVFISFIPLSLSVGTSLDYGHLFTCLIGIFSLIVCLAAIGLFFSTIFTQQSLAALSAFFVTMLLWTAHSASGPDASTVDLIFQSISMANHFTRFTEGVLASASIAYFLIVTVIFMLMGIWKINAMRSLDW